MPLCEKHLGSKPIPELQLTSLCEGHLFTHLILAADDITTHAPLRGASLLPCDHLRLWSDYNSRPSARDILLIHKGFLPFGKITTHAPLRGASATTRWLCGVPVDYNSRPSVRGISCNWN